MTEQSASRSDGEQTGLAFRLEVIATNLELGLPMGALERGFLREAAAQLRTPRSERGALIEENEKLKKDNAWLNAQLIKLTGDA